MSFFIDPAQASIDGWYVGKNKSPTCLWNNQSSYVRVGLAYSVRGIHDGVCLSFSKMASHDSLI